LDDFGVEASICGRRDDAGEAVQVVGSACANQVSGARELSGNGDDVGWLAAAVERVDRAKDEFVLWGLEVVGANVFEDIGHCVLREQHAA
jgi:hypothetical protein